MKCYWDKLDSPIGPIYLGAINEGLVYCDISKGSEDDLRRWCAIHLPGYTLQRGDNHIINMAKQQLSGYFAGKNKKLNVPLKFTGTPFQNRVWQALTTIPYGETRTYGQIAAQIDCPKGARAVGYANNKNPIALFVP